MSDSESVVVVTDVVSELVSDADEESLDISEVLEDETELVSSDEVTESLLYERRWVDVVSSPLVSEKLSLSWCSKEGF